MDNLLKFARDENALSADRRKDLLEVPQTEGLDRNPETRRIIEKEMMPYADALYRFAIKLTGDEDEAGDLLQETYLKACRYIDHFEPGSNAKAWLYRILKNSFINEYRRKKRTPQQVGYEDIVKGVARPTPDYMTYASRSDYWSKNLIGDEVSRAIQSLPVDYRVVVVLCDIEDFSYEEIANIVDIPVGTVRSRLHRGRKILREQLVEYAMSMGFKINKPVKNMPSAEV